MNRSEHNGLIINLEGIFFKYSGSNNNVIENLDLKLYHGNRIGVRAPNGSGKTTLFYIIMGLLMQMPARLKFLAAW